MSKHRPMSKSPTPSPRPERPATPIDPVQAWRDWFVANEREWSESLTRLMKDDTVARSVGKEINSALLGQQMFTQQLAGPLAAMNLPTREDMVALGERLGQLEDAVARIEAMMVQTRHATLTDPTTRPPRTRKAPKAAAPPAKAPRSGKR